MLLKKRRLFLGAILFSMLVVVVFIAGKNRKAYAVAQTTQTIYSALSERKISFSDASISEQTLFVKLLSTGDTRCTLADVKAIQAIYEVVRAQTINEIVKNVDIEIFNPEGKRIYDVHENNVSSPMEYVENSMKEVRKNTEMKGDEVLSEVANIVDRYPYSIKESKINVVNEFSSEKLQLTLQEIGDTTKSVSSVNGIYDAIESLSRSTGVITQCEITVQDIDGGCVLYMAGDFLYGNCIAWISPMAERSFFIEEGPR